jgi:predicted nucleic acid-binding protein
MPFVLDASIVAAWALADESSPIAELADSCLDTDTALVPRIWWYEIRNLLIINERRNRITAPDSASFLQNLAGYPIEISQMEDEQAVFRIARHFRLSFYDAAYLELAQRNGMRLATLDRSLRSAAQSGGIPLLA